MKLLKDLILMELQWPHMFTTHNEAPASQILKMGENHDLIGAAAWWRLTPTNGIRNP